ncbi:MAG: tetratricopeptide repeat protein [Betaproteobacteria bacterium]
MQADRYGLEMSCASQDARDAYVEGVDLFLSANFGSEAAFGRAIAAEPGFALAHAALGRTQQLYARIDAAKASVARARSLSTTLPRRERRNVEIVASLVDGVGAPPLAAALEHLAEFPRDVMVLAPCTGVFGLIGFSGRAGREMEQVRQLDALAGEYGEDWWFLSTHAFALSETGQVEAGRKLIERSLATYPRNAHGAHVFSHVLYESGEDAAGLAYLEAWMRDFPREAQLHCHLSWHLALWHLEAGNIDAARHIYTSAVRPGGSWGPPINTLSDSASFLWRSQLAGHRNAAAAWGEVRDYALKEFPRAGVTFADVHSAVAYAASADRDALQSLVAQLREREAAGKLAAGPVVPALAEAFGAYAGRQWDAAVACIEPVLTQHERIGGSRAQRDLIECTLIAALANAGRDADARRLAVRGARTRSVKAAV